MNNCEVDDFMLLACIAMVAMYVGKIMKKPKKNRQVRRYGVRPINRNRVEMGMYNNFIKAMVNHDQEYFFKYTRMSPNMFANLLRLVQPRLEKQKTTKCPITASQRLIITLHYLSEGCSQQEIAFGYRVGFATVSNIIRETVVVLYEILQPIVMPVPTKEDWKTIEKGFWNRWNMPNCVGAVDGKHVAIKCPPGTHSRYYNYKKHFSVVLMAACDAFYRFIVIDVGGEGSNPDGAIFRNSGFGSKLLDNKINLPDPKYLPNSRIILPHYIVADAAFPLHTNIMRPYPGSYLGVEKNIFNYRLSRARRVIENAFGILTQRFRIYFKPIDALIDTCENIVLCTIVLHNYIQKCEEDLPVNERKYCPTGYVDMEKDGDISLRRWRNNPIHTRKIKRVGANNATQAAKGNRDLLKDFFLSPEGSVSWQHDYVTRGSVKEDFAALYTN